MAGELFAAKKLPSVAATATAVQQYQQQNISNNNTVQGCNWQGLYPTIRERYTHTHRMEPSHTLLVVYHTTTVY